MLLNPKLLNASEMRAKLPTLLEKYTFKEKDERLSTHDRCGTQIYDNYAKDPLRANFNMLLQESIEKEKKL